MPLTDCEHLYHARCKVWHGEEDNEVLANLVTTLDASADDFQQQLYSALEAKYPKN